MSNVVILLWKIKVKDQKAIRPHISEMYKITSKIKYMKIYKIKMIHGVGYLHVHLFCWFY
jgi:hypothetical protein